MEETQAITSKKPMNKSEIIAAMGEATGLTKQQVTGVFDELMGLIKRNLDEQGPSVFTIPDLLQIKVCCPSSYYSLAAHTRTSPSSSTST
jgi:hypothetical protein